MTLTMNIIFNMILNFFLKQITIHMTLFIRLIKLECINSEIIMEG